MNTYKIYDLNGNIITLDEEGHVINIEKPSDKKKGD